MVGAVQVDRGDGQSGPLRGLPAHQAAHQGRVGQDLVGVHPGRWHGRIIAKRAAGGRSLLGALDATRGRSGPRVPGRRASGPLARSIRWHVRAPPSPAPAWLDVGAGTGMCCAGREATAGGSRADGASEGAWRAGVHRAEPWGGRGRRVGHGSGTGHPTCGIPVMPGSGADGREGTHERESVRAGLGPRRVTRGNVGGCAAWVGRRAGLDLTGRRSRPRRSRRSTWTSRSGGRRRRTLPSRRGGSWAPWR